MLSIRLPSSYEHIPPGSRKSPACARRRAVRSNQCLMKPDLHLPRRESARDRDILENIKGPRPPPYEFESADASFELLVHKAPNTTETEYRVGTLQRRKGLRF